MTITIDVIIDKLPDIIARLPGAMDAAMGEVADDVSSDAQGRAPVKTGKLKSLISAARVGEASYEVRSEAEYSVYVEMGTRKMAAQPFFTPACDAAEGRVRAAFADLEGRL